MKLNRPILRRAGLIVAIAAGVLQCWLAHGAEQPETPLNIVVLYSGDMFLPATVTQDRAMRETFSAGTKRSVNFYAETLHAHNLSAISFDTEFTSFMRRKYQSRKIDLIIAGGTAALNFLERHRPELWPESPAMFFSVDETSNLHRKFPPGMTGLTIKFDPATTLEFAVQLQPDARRVVVVTGASEFDRSWLPGNPNGVAAGLAVKQPQPCWGWGNLRFRSPKVARASQPWALSRNPFGIHPPGSSQTCGR